MSKWKIRSISDVAEFWSKVREVPRRTEGRTHKQYERHYLGIYLLALADNKLLSYPLKIEEPDSKGQGQKSPDFMLVWESGETTGLEVTRATDEELQRWMTRAEKEHPEGSAIMDSPHGYAGDQLEQEWCGLVRRAIEKKVALFPGYRPASRYDLLVADDTRMGAGDRRKSIAILTPWVRELKQKEPKVGKISVVASLDVLYDIGGEVRIFPYIEWSAPKLDDAAEMETFFDRVEHAGRIAAARAIGQHQIAGTPIYFMDHKDRLVKQTADGRRFEVRVRKNGEEITLQELSR